MTVVYFEIEKSDLRPLLIDWYKGMCEREYETTELEVIFSCEIEDKIRYACMEVSAPGSEKFRQASALGKAYAGHLIVSSFGSLAH